MNKGKSKRENSLTIKNQNNLTTAFLNLLKSKDYDDISVIDLCQEAGVPRATFYNHYLDKYDFTRECLIRLQRRVSPAVKVHTVDEYYCIIMNNLLDYLTEYKQIFMRINEINGAVISYELQKVFSQDILRLLNHLEDKGVILDVPSELVAEFYAGGIVSMCRSWVSQQCTCTKDELLRYGAFMVDKGRAFARLE